MKNISILPADTYSVINKTVINDTDRKIVSMLYQPIIGPISISLYLSLWSDLDKMEWAFGHDEIIKKLIKELGLD